jgi:predicted nucleotidyltransferase
VMRSFRDRDYLKTPEGFIFAVIGNVHPADRVIAYLKYIPDEHGKWGRSDTRYRRALEHYNVPSVMDSMRFLRRNAPQYVFESSVHGITLTAVPLDRITKHFRPEERLVQLRASAGRDELEKKTLRLVELILREGGSTAESIGITGSLLPEIHDPAFSDIDLVVYGFSNAARVRSLMQKLKESPSASVRRLVGSSREKWIAERLASTPLTQKNAVKLLARKWNIGTFEGTDFSVHPVRTEIEILERYGDERYVALGIVGAAARATDVRESLFMPAIYRVEPTHPRGAFSTYAVDTIVSFEGLYADIAESGEVISCRGKLERVESPFGVKHRIVVGSPEAKGRDYLLPIS